MRTSLPFSTISYCSPDFLKASLQSLIDAPNPVLSWYAFIVHEPEPGDSQGGKKKHAHVIAYPARACSTDSILRDIQEPDPDPDKSSSGLMLRCMPARKSKFSDWFMYSLHDPVYLASKGMERHFEYKVSDFITSDFDFLLAEVASIEHAKLTPFAAMSDAVLMGLSWEDYFALGKIPPAQFIPYRAAYQALVSSKNRRDRFLREG